MKIDRKLNLVMTINRDDGSHLFVHATPISKEVFQPFWELSGRTMNALFSRGLGLFAPRHACDMLKTLARESGGDKELARVERGFLAEIRRLTNVFAPTDKGWEMLPLDDAKSSGMIDEDEADEVDGALCFFICGSRALLKSQMSEIQGALSLFNAQTSLLSCTEYRASLPTSIKAASTGATQAA